MLPRRLALALPWAATGLLGACLVLLWPMRHQGPAALALLLNAVLLPAPLLLRQRAPHRSTEVMPDAPALVAAAPASPAPSEVRNQLLTQLSHAVRTPLNAVMGMTQLALQTRLTAEQRDLLQQADAASQALLGLLHDALDVAALESGQATMARHPLRLEDVVAQALEQVRPAHARPEVALICDWVSPDLLHLPGQLLGDAARLQRVLVTLLTNALKFTLAGEVRLRVQGELDPDRAHVQLTLAVQDSGIGMSAQQLQAAFPVDDAANRPTGPAPRLGLAHTLRLVALMGGRLQAQSAVSRGTEVALQLSLPLDGHGQTPQAPRPQRLLLAQGAGAAGDSLQALIGHLAGADRVARGLHASQTLELLAQAHQAGQPFDSVLLDWRLPGPGAQGLELLALLRRDHPTLRVAVLSGPGQDDDLLQARSFGARAVLPSPLTPGDLRAWCNEPDDRPTVADHLPLAGLRVLLVEDHPVNRDIAQRLLTSVGAAVTPAIHGQDGLAQLLGQAPDAFHVVLMDLQMPVLDGWAATRELRRQPGFEALPVLAMTAFAGAEEREQCLAAGMQGHITKPLDMTHLVRSLQPFLPQAAPAAPELVLDHALGLRQFDGHAALYQRTLRAFSDQYADGLGAWSGWLADGQWAELRRGAHTLQGLAATLGARPLHRAALALEMSAAAADAGHATPLLQGVCAALAALQATLASAADTLAPAAPPLAPSGTPADLQALRDLLAQSDSRALDWWQAHGRAAALSPEARQGVDAALGVMDFDAAAAALDRELDRDRAPAEAQP
ncbi:hybrid sensor histidine kinase/response regulator [Roseateles sp. BYS87W]|uniref:histidine kinase n=1 Tax=Pelomonas baiyunensis TaxID=3299026 RepID=A0ABW7GXV3_9BURK